MKAENKEGGDRKKRNEAETKRLKEGDRKEGIPSTDFQKVGMLFILTGS